MLSKTNTWQSTLVGGHGGQCGGCEQGVAAGGLRLDGLPMVDAYMQWYLLQGEERDSSDEEWADAYARMDPISQLGWRSRRGVVEGPAQQLMRDVLEAADGLQHDAMAEMGASRNNADDLNLNAGASVAGPIPRDVSGSRSPSASVEVDQDGMS